ncbi:MAG: SlyX family protein [Treponemataceae bacterium]|nr:SlyX family protein [Treponemataceae bacterium]
MDGQESAERLTALEMKAAYLEDFLNQLQEVVVAQEKSLEALRRENKLLVSKLRDVSELLEGDIPNRKPPHY